MTAMKLSPIGRTETTPDAIVLRIDEPLRPALEGLDQFSHVLVLWWADKADTPVDRARTSETSPYLGGPEEIGTFATRSFRRPNPICVSVAQLLWVDTAAGTVGVCYLDTEPDTPLLDLKPYTPSADRVDSPATPPWCASWPRSLEESAAFDWSSVFA